VDALTNGTQASAAINAADSGDGGLDEQREPEAKRARRCRRPRRHGFTFDGEKVSVVNGQLTLLGKTGAVTLKATSFNCYLHPMLKREVCGGDFETVIQRSRWGMSWGLNFGIPDNVKLLVQVEAVKQQILPMSRRRIGDSTRLFGFSSILKRLHLDARAPAARDQADERVDAERLLEQEQGWHHADQSEGLQADENLLRAADARAQARPEFARAAVATFKALGGGWQPGDPDTVAVK